MSEDTNINHNNSNDNRLLKRTKSRLYDMHMQAENARQLRYGYRYTWVLSMPRGGDVVVYSKHLLFSTNKQQKYNSSKSISDIYE